MAGTANFPARPKPLRVKAEGIPDALKKLKQFVLWTYELKRPKVNGGTAKWTKVPRQINGYGADTTKPNTWCAFDDALSAYQDGRSDGIGFVTSKADKYVLIDLDHALDSTTGKIELWAFEILKSAQLERAYCELSIGRSGFHIIQKGPQGFDGKKINNVEIYCHSRFFTMSGWTVPPL